MKGISRYLYMAMAMSLLLDSNIISGKEYLPYKERELTEREKDIAIANYKKECEQKYKNNQLPKKLRKKLGV